MIRRGGLFLFLALVCPGIVYAQSVTVNYAVPAGASTPLALGGVGWPTNAAGQQALSSAGVTFIRFPWPIDQLVPNTTLAAYQSALAAGCPAGSVCDPSTWNWFWADVGLSAHNAGMKTYATIGNQPPWMATSNQQAFDWNVYQDVVAKMIKHFSPDYTDFANEPDLNGISPSDYVTIFIHSANAIRVANNQVPTGGPGVFDNGSTGQAYLTALANAGIRPDFVSYHGYDQSLYEATGILNLARQLWPDIRVIDGEWSYQGTADCSQVPLDGNDPTTVAFVGSRIIDDLKLGIGATYYGMSDSAGGNQVDCLVFQPINATQTNDVPLPKLGAWKVLSSIGFDQAADLVSGTVSGLTNAVGGINAQHQPVVAISNDGAAQTVSLQLAGLGIGNGDHQLTTYLADFSGFSQGTSTVNVSGGTVNVSVPMTANSVVGLVLGAIINPPPPTPTPTPTVSPTPTPSSTPTPAGCTISITSPVIGSTIPGPPTVTLGESGCGGDFNRLQITNHSGNYHVDFTGTSVALSDTTTGPWTVSDTAWSDGTYMGQIGASDNDSFTVSGGPTSTPTLTPTPTATPCVPHHGVTCGSPTPTSTPTATSSSTPTPTVTVTATPTKSATATPTASASPTPTTSASPTPTSSATGTPVPGSAAAFLNITSVDDQFIASGETAPQELQMIQYLGVKHVRQDFMCGDPQGCTGLGDPIGALVANAQQGGYTYITQPNCGPNGTNLDAGSISFDISVDQAWGNTLYALGGCNEPNNQPYFYNSVGCFENGTSQGCINFAQDFYAAAKAAFPTIPVFSQPEAGGAELDNVGLQFQVNNGVKQADYMDLHNYYDRGNNTWVPGILASAFENNGLGDSYDGMSGEYCGSTFGKGFPATSPANCPTVPRVSTETGWSYTDGGLTEDQRGKLLTSGYAMGYMSGEPLVSYYVLYNGSGFELFYDSNGPHTPTVTIPASYIHNLTTILADPIANFTPSCPDVLPNGANDPTDHWMTLAKSNGKCDFVFVPDRPTGNNVETISIPEAGSIYDITTGTAPTGTGNSFTANDHIMIVEF